MWKIFWQEIKSLLRWYKGKKKKAYAGNFLDTDVQPDCEEARSTIKRITLLTAPLRSHRNGHPETKCMKVAGFTEAYRFFIMLCKKPDFPIRRKAGHLYYTATLSYSCGSVELIDKSGIGRKVVAVMRLNIPALPDLCEIRFVK